MTQWRTPDVLEDAMKPLEGIKILEFSTMITASFAAKAPKSETVKIWVTQEHLWLLLPCDSTFVCAATTRKALVS